MPRNVARQQRSSIVNFRVTEDELNELVFASKASGCRSLSDFARNAALELARSHSASSPGPSRLESFTLASTLSSLNSTLREIKQLLRNGSDAIQTPVEQ